jgi:hypothetical protein
MLSHVVACCRMLAGVRMRRYATALRWQVGEYVEEFHAVPQKLVVSIQGCGAAPEPGPGLKCATPLAYQDLLQVHVARHKEYLVVPIDDQSTYACRAKVPRRAHPFQECRLPASGAVVRTKPVLVPQCNGHARPMRKRYVVCCVTRVRRAYFVRHCLLRANRFIRPCAHAASAACACAATWPHTASQDSSAPPRCSVVNRTAQAAAMPSAASGCAPAAAPAPARGWELLEKPTVDGPEVLNDGALRRRVRSATPPSREPSASALPQGWKDTGAAARSGCPASWETMPCRLPCHTACTGRHAACPRRWVARWAHLSTLSHERWTSSHRPCLLASSHSLRRPRGACPPACVRLAVRSTKRA